MSLTDDINNLPASPREVMPGHLSHHATIHSALKNHNSHLTAIDRELDTVDTELSQRIDGKANAVHSHTSGHITDAVSSIASSPNRVIKTNSKGKITILTGSITEKEDPTNKEYVDAADTALREHVDDADAALREHVDAADNALREHVDAADAALGKRIDLLFPSSIRAGQVLKWDGTKYIPSWLDQHSNQYNNRY